jgi:hypothetical protein
MKFICISALLVLAYIFPAKILLAKELTQTPLDITQWSYATDPYGSEAIIHGQLLQNKDIWIKFTRVPRLDEGRNSWIELIYQLPNATLLGKSKIKVTYKCSIDLLIKLSQKDYGKDGDGSYAHYQIKLPASDEWLEQEVDLADFTRPVWTPDSSIDVGIVPKDIDVLYFTPSLTDEKGGEAILQIRAVELLP